MTLKSDVVQKVYLTAFTWNDRGIPDQCQDKDNGLYHAIAISTLPNTYIWNFGEYEMEPFTVQAGESVTIEMEWNFSNEAHAKDWSITAYGNGKTGTLHLAHDRGLKSDFWTTIER